MRHTRITIPETVSLAQLVEWNNDLWKPSNELEIRIDFINTKFFTPFAMMFIIHQIEYYKFRFKASIVILENFQHLNWPKNMGFFSTINSLTFSGSNTENSNYENSNSSKFLPITTLLTTNFKQKSGRSLLEINEAIDSETIALTRALTQLGSGYTFDTVQYLLREIIRNVFEHSGSDNVRYCAQYWPTRKKVELIISDCGMGIYDSLKGNPSFKNINERDALHFACMPGVSGNAQAMRERSSANPWRNSGYGLYMTSRLCRNDGDFLIISNNHALFLKQNGKTDFRIPNTRGTIIRLHIQFGENQSLRSNLERYTKEGKSISEGIRGAKVLEASAASQMLRRDFDEKPLNEIDL